MSFFLAINVVDINQTETIAKSIAPSIYGSIDMKKAIACLLFGGSRKRLGLFVEHRYNV
jgi:DNA replicative helicase MCM subunit Mcm2 (Cdc46/Mcm family)